MTCSKTDRYSVKSSPILGFAKTGMPPKYYLICWNDSSHLADHARFFPISKAWKNGQHLSIDLEMNRLSATIIPISFWISLTVFRD